MPDDSLVFIDVDTQRDFLEPIGALFIAGSEAIRPNLARLTRFALEHGIPIIATACDHLPDDPEFEVFPPHCVSGTEGQARVPETAVAQTVVLKVDQTYAGERPKHLTLSKRQYDVFHREDAASVMQAHASDSTRFVVYGVATDYCVRCVVEGLLDRGHRVEVVVDATRAVDASREPDVLSQFAHQGATLTLTERICSES